MSDVVVLRRESSVTYVRGSASSPIIQSTPAPTLVIQREGIRGLPGEQGPPGTIGAAIQYTPPDVSLIWTITHNLSRFPMVRVYDTLNRQIYPNVTHLSINITQLDFDIPMTGTAYLN